MLLSIHLIIFGCTNICEHEKKKRYVRLGYNSSIVKKALYFASKKKKKKTSFWIS